MAIQRLLFISNPIYDPGCFSCPEAGQHRTPRGVSKAMDTAAHSHPSTCWEATRRRDQARSSRLSSGISPLHIPLQAPQGIFTRPHKKITPVRMKEPSRDSGASWKSMPGDPECLIPPLPSDCLNNLDLRCHPFHPPAPTPDSSPERRK